MASMNGIRRELQTRCRKRKRPVSRAETESTKKQKQREEEEEEEEEEEVNTLFAYLYEPASDDDDELDEYTEDRIDTGMRCMLSQRSLYARSALSEFCEIGIDQYRSDGMLRTQMGSRLFLREPCSVCKARRLRCDISCMRRFDERPLLRDALETIYLQSMAIERKLTVPGVTLAGPLRASNGGKSILSIDRTHSRMFIDQKKEEEEEKESPLDKNADNLLCLRAARAVGDLARSCRDREVIFVTSRAGEKRCGLGVVTDGFKPMLQEAFAGSQVWLIPKTLSQFDERKIDRTSEIITHWLDAEAPMRALHRTNA